MEEQQSQDQSSVASIAREFLEFERQRTQDKPSDPERRSALFKQLMTALHSGASAGSKSAVERRRFLRVPAQLKVRFRAGEATITATAVELGLGGLSLRGHLWLLNNQKMSIESVRVGSKAFPLRISARVVWRITEGEDEPCAGLEFIDLSDEGRGQIHAIFSAVFIGYLEFLADPDSHD